jgi:hypothetical protein
MKAESRLDIRIDYDIIYGSIYFVINIANNPKAVKRTVVKDAIQRETVSW